MPLISPVLPNDGETAEAADVNTPFNAILSLLNGGLDQDNILPGSMTWAIMSAFTNQIPSAAMQDSGNLDKFRTDAHFSFVRDGLIWSAISGLAGAMTSGHIYTPSGIFLTISAIATHTFTASKDTYVSISPTGTVSYQEASNGGSRPSLASNYLWLYKVVTNGSAVTSVADLRKLSPLPTISTASIGSISLTNGAISSLGVAASTGSATTEGIWNVEGVVDLPTLGVVIPDYAQITGAEIWVHASGNLSQTGYARMAVVSISTTSFTFRGQVAGNGGASNNMLNTTNSKLEGNIFYLS